MNNSYAVGEQVYLRPLEQEDAEAIVRWFNDQDVARTLRMWKPMTKGAEAHYLEEVARSEHDVVLGICLRDGDRFVGVTGLHGFELKNRSAMFGILVGEKDLWGKGYGTEATSLIVGVGFGTMNLNRIWLEVFSENERGIRAYEKVGFKREGTLRQTDYREGRWHDSLVMGMLRDEWKPAQPPPASR